MEHGFVIIPTAVAVFATTNIDDLIVLTFFFMAARDGGRLRPWQVLAGQAVGVAVLIASAAAAALSLVAVPSRWVGLLGVFPLAYGLYKLIASWRTRPGPDSPLPVAASLGSVAAVAIVNGADNITIYTPLLRDLPTGEVLVTLAVFAAMICLWCATAAWLGSRLGAIAAIRRISHRLVPLVLIAIGAIILTRAVTG